MADLTSSLRQMRGPFLTDETETTGPQTPSSGAMQSGLTSALTGISAGSVAKEALSAERSGASGVTALRARAGQLAAESEQELPEIRDYKQVDGVESGAKYLAGAFGGMIPYIPAAVGGAAAARVLGPSALRAFTPTVGAAAGIYPLEKGQAVLDQYMDPVQAAAPAEQRDNVATTRAAINAGLLGNVSSNLITGLAGRSLRGFLGATAEGALPNMASEYVGQKSQEYLNPDRDTANDTDALINAGITGGALGAAAHVPSAGAHQVSAAGQRTAQMARDAATDLTNRFRRDPDAQGDAEINTPGDPSAPGGIMQDAKEFASTVNDRVLQPGMEAAKQAYEDFKPTAKEKAKQAGDYVGDTVKKFNDAAKEAEDFPDFARRAFSDDTTDLENLAAGDQSPEFKKADGSIDEEKLFASDEPRRAKTEQNAMDMMNDPDTSDEIRRRVESFNGDYSTPEAQSFINNARLGQRSAQRARDAVQAFKKGTSELLKKAKDAVPEATKAAGEAIDNAKDAIIKKNRQDPKTSVEVESAVFRNLKDELQAQPAVIKQVPELAKVISRLLAQGASVDDASLKAFGDFNALNDLFADPAKALEKIAKTLGADDIYKRRAKFTTAYEDSKKPDSMLFKAIPMEHRDTVTAPMLKKLGRFVDELGDKNDAEFNAGVDGLARVYGSREAAVAVVDYYRRANESELKIDADDVTHDSDEAFGEHDAELANQGIEKREIPTDVVFASVDDKHARPFHTSEMQRLKDKIETSKGPTGEGYPEKMSSFVNREGRDPVDELDRVERDIKSRIEDHKKHKEYAAKNEFRLQQVKNLEDQLAGIKKHRDTVNSDEMFAGLNKEERAMMAAETALQDFYVGRMQGEKGDKTVADDGFLREARFGYSKAKQDTRENNKDQFVEFEKTDGKTLTLHAPSMVKAMSRRRPQQGTETSRNRAASLLKESVAAILERDDIASLKTNLKNVRFEKEASIGAAETEQQRVTKKVVDANAVFKSAQDALDKNYEKMAEAIAAIKEGTFDLNRSQFFGDLAIERDALKAKMAKARKDGADIPNETNEKRERETQGLTDIVKDILDKEGGSRTQQEMGRERRENDLRTSSEGKYAKETPHDIKKQIHDLKKRLEEPGTPAEKKRIRDEMAALQRRLRVVEASAPKPEDAEQLKKQAQEDIAHTAFVEEQMKKFFGDDELAKLRDADAPGALGDPDKSQPDYLQKKSLKKEIGPAGDKAYTAAFHGPAEHGRRVAEAFAGIEKFAKIFSIPLDEAFAKKNLADITDAFKEASKGFFINNEFKDASKKFHQAISDFADEAFARGATPEEIILEMGALRNLGYRVFVPVSDKTAAHARKIVDNILGEHFDLRIGPYIDGTKAAGEYSNKRGKETIEISSIIASAFYKDPDQGFLDTVHHEIFHAITARIERLHGIDLVKKLAAAVEQPHIREQTLAAIPDEGIRDYIKSSPEELLVETFAQWMNGKVKLNATDRRVGGFFNAIKNMIIDVLKALRGDQLLHDVFSEVKEGALKDYELDAGAVNRSFEAREAAGMFAYDTNNKAFSKENAATGRDMTPEEATAVREHVLKTRGPDVQVTTDKLAADIGGSGSYYKDNVKRVIEIARDAMNPLSVAHHESMHDFFHTLLTDTDSRRVRDDLLRAANAPFIQAQLRALLRDHPDALAQVLKDPEERLSYMYQFWAAGTLRVSPTANTIFGKVAKWLRDVIGIVTVREKADAIMTAFHNGRLADPSTAGAVIADLQMKTLGERLEKLTGPVAKLAGKILSPATERLHNSNIPAFVELAEMFHKEPGRESGGLAFLQRRYREGGIRFNKLQDIVGNSTQAEMAAALKELQSMQPATTELGKNIRKFLDEMHDYMTEAGVQNSSLDPVSKKVVWEPIRRVKDYFPRVWDRAMIRNNKDEFIALLAKEGEMTPAEAETIFKSVQTGDGFGELAENEHHLGFTPYSAAVKNRGLTFIRKDNAHLFEKFQNKDLINVMQTYVYQAAHRAEYARDFGNDGEKIKELLARGKREGATEEELLDAAKTVRALEGTLGADINPRLRELYSGIVGYENIVLLPFALFSSLIDPLGVAVRSGKLADAAIAFKDGMTGLAKDFLRMDKGKEYEMARTIGVIEDLNKMEAMGQFVGSQYMSGWMRKFNDNFFKYNGMETWNERMRVSAMGAGMRFMVRNKDNARYMDELGLKSGDIVELPDGKIARTTDEGLTKEQEKRVQEAIYRFVDGAILRPNAAHRPVWSSDPHFMLIAHLKQYTFSFQQTILKQVSKEFQNGNNMPAFVLASYIPFMAAADLMRGSVTGSIKTAWTLSDFIADGVARSGVLGTGSFATDAMKDASMGKLPGSSFLGPAIQHVIQAAQTVAGAPGADLESLIMRSVPASPLAKAVS